MEVFSEEWCVACCERLSQRESYRLAAAGWEGASVLLMSAEPLHGIHSDRAVWLDVNDGACRGARIATAEDLEAAAYVFRATPADWKQGEDVIIVPSLQDPKEIAERFPQGYRTIKPYLRVTPQPK